MHEDDIGTCLGIVLIILYLLFGRYLVLISNTGDVILHETLECYCLNFNCRKSSRLQKIVDSPHLLATSSFSSPEILFSCSEVFS